MKLWTSGLVLGGLREALVSFISCEWGVPRWLQEGVGEIIELLLNKGWITGSAGEL